MQPLKLEDLNAQFDSIVRRYRDGGLIAYRDACFFMNDMLNPGETFNREFVDNLNFWGKISGFPVEQRSVIYAGTKAIPLTDAHIVPWDKLSL